MSATIYVASAGTGKTTTLLDKLEEVLESVPPERVAFTTYTNAGAGEAVDRAVKRFKLDRERFRYFRTLHSLCFRALDQTDMLGFGDYVELGRKLGYPITGASAVSAKDGVAMGTATRGDRLLTLDGLKRNRLCGLRDVCRSLTGRPEEPESLRHFSEAYRSFRRSLGKIDFTDMLELFLEQERVPEIEVFFLDEAQDLSKLQWAVADMLQRQASQTFIAGDDKQAIYEFSGADPASLIEAQGERIVLEKTYRLPSNILSYAEDIASRIGRKTPYTVSPARDGGLVRRIQDLGQIDLSEGTWLVLARNRCFLEVFERQLAAAGLLFKSVGKDTVPPTLLPAIAAWERLVDGGHIDSSEAKSLYARYLPTGSRVKRGSKKKMAAVPDGELVDYETLKADYGLVASGSWDTALQIPDNLAAYLKAAERRGPLTGAVRIEVATIHATKGREADSVVVLPDMAWATWNEFQKNPDSEHRAFYVAATRAREALYVHHPLTENFYPMP